MRRTKEIKLLLKNIRRSWEVSPDPVFKRNTRIRILNQIREYHSPKLTLASDLFKLSLKFLSFRFVSRFVIVGLLLIFIAAPTTILAAQGSIPSQTLYPVKRLSEDIALEIAPLPWKKTLALVIAQRRSQELEELKKENKENLIEVVNREYKNSLKKVEALENLKAVNKGESVENNSSSNSASQTSNETSKKIDIELQRDQSDGEENKNDTKNENKADNKNKKESNKDESKNNSKNSKHN